MRRQAVGVSFERRGAAGAEQPDVRHLPENDPGRVLPAPDSPRFAPLVLPASPKDGKVWGLAGIRARAGGDPPPHTAFDARGGVLERGDGAPRRGTEAVWCSRWALKP